LYCAAWSIASPSSKLDDVGTERLTGRAVVLRSVEYRLAFVKDG
jgi:hypothetical protein